MTFATLARLLDDLTAKTGSYRGATENADSAEALDWAFKLLAQKCSFFDPAVTFTPVLNQATYRLNDLTVFGRKIVEPLTLIINGNPCSDASGRRAGLYSIQELNELFPQWRTASASTSSVAVAYGSNTLMVYPKPSQSVLDAGNNFVEATIVPGWIKANGTYVASGASGLYSGGVWDTTASPDLADEFHEALAVMAAVKLGKPVVDSDAAWNTLNAYSAELTTQVDDLARRNRAAMSSLGSIKPTDRSDRWLRL